MNAFKLPTNWNATPAHASPTRRTAAGGNLRDFHPLALAACTTGWPGWGGCGFVGSQVSAAPRRSVPLSEQMAGNRWGRVLLHVACACRDHKVQWHWRGVRREFAAA